MWGQCIDSPPDSVPLPRQHPARQLCQLRGLFLLDVYGCKFQSRKKSFIILAVPACHRGRVVPLVAAEEEDLPREGGDLEEGFQPVRRQELKVDFFLIFLL